MYIFLSIVQDKARYTREMAGYVPPPGEGKRKQKKDPNAPKRALSAFFFFCGERRGEVKAQNPAFGLGDIAKELGKQWEKVGDKAKYEKMAAEDKKRFEREMAAYNKGECTCRVCWIGAWSRPMLLMLQRFLGGSSGGSSAKKSKVEVSDDESEEDSD